MNGFKLLMWVSFIFLLSCQIKKSDNGLSLSPSAPPDTTSGAPPDSGFSIANGTLSLADMKQSALKTCQNCHAGHQKPNLISAADWKGRETDVLNEIEGGDMPPTDEGYQALSACEVALIKRWFDLGAPETSQIPMTTVAECAQKNLMNTEDTNNQ